MNSINVSVSENELQQAVSHSLLDKAGDYPSSLVIKTDEDFEAASVFVKDATAAKNDLNNTRLGLTRPIDDAKSKIMLLFKPRVEILDKAIKTVREKMGKYQEDQEKLRRAAALEAAQKAEREAARREKWADDADERGDHERAEEHRAKADTALASVPQVAERPKSSVALRDYYNVNLVNMKELCAAIAAGKVPESLVTLAQGPANQYAKATKAIGNAIPGCITNVTRR